jgi:hypothetical protein
MCIATQDTYGGVLQTLGIWVSIYVYQRLLYNSLEYFELGYVGIQIYNYVPWLTYSIHIKMVKYCKCAGYGYIKYLWLNAVNDALL